MLVTITGFGSVWRRHIRKEENDPTRFARAAYFNTTGVCVNGKIRTRSQIVGHLRFNSVGGFDANRPLAMINSVFECAEPCIWNGQNKVFFKKRLHMPHEADSFLVVVRSREVGHLDVGSPGWRSEGTLLISFSECRDEQEAMLLMPSDSWLRTDLGKFVLQPLASQPWSRRLQLKSE